MYSVILFRLIFKRISSKCFITRKRIRCLQRLFLSLYRNNEIAYLLETLLNNIALTRFTGALACSRRFIS